MIRCIHSTQALCAGAVADGVEKSGYMKYAVSTGHISDNITSLETPAIIFQIDPITVIDRRYLFPNFGA